MVFHREGSLSKVKNAKLDDDYGEEDEAEADRAGIAYLEAAKLDASGLATFFDRMAAEKGKDEERGAFMSSHPTSKARAEAARRRPMGAEGQSLNSEEWAMLKTACAPK